MTKENRPLDADRISASAKPVRRSRNTTRDFICSIGATLALSAGAATAQVNDAPLTESWAPTEWGADDSVGAVNRTTPELVLQAVGLVKQGKVATLGKIYAGDAPAFGAAAGG